MSNSLTFEPLIPVFLLWIIAALAMMVSGLSIYKSWKGGILRTLALTGILAVLAHPVWREEERTPVNDMVLVLIDETASQTLDERTEITRKALTALRADIGQLDRLDIVEHTIKGEDETNLAANIIRRASEIPTARLAGIFVITDGRYHDQETRLKTLSSAINVPIHLLLSGREQERDRVLQILQAPRYGIVHEKVRISFRVDDRTIDLEPHTEHTQTMVSLRINGEEILRRNVPLGRDIVFDAPLKQPGPLIIELESDARPGGELTLRNNIAVLNVNAIRDRLRVLLISGEPHPGERVWRNLLKSDPAIDLIHFTILRPTNKFGDNALPHELALIEFPRDELFIEKLSEFDLLIFDRYTYRAVLGAYHFENIARYVQEGGGVLIASGPEYYGPLSLAARRNLSFILPALPTGAAIEQAFRPQISDLGARHPVTAQLPESDFWGRWLRTMPTQQRRGTTLMKDANGHPLLVLDRVGDGRVGLLLSDHVWLWARGFDGGGPHRELLRRVAHWLMKEPELEEERLLLSEQSGDLLLKRQSLATSPPPVSLTFPDGSTKELTLEPTSAGDFEYRLTDAPHGIYRARSDALFAIGAVGLVAPPEFQSVLTDRNAAQALIAEQGGGLYMVRRGERVALPALRRISSKARRSAGANWAGIMDKKSYQIEGVRTAPLLPFWTYWIVIAITALGAWIVESGRFSSRSRHQQPSPT